MATHFCVLQDAIRPLSSEEDATLLAFLQWCRESETRAAWVDASAYVLEGTHSVIIDAGLLRGNLESAYSLNQGELPCPDAVRDVLPILAKLCDQDTPLVWLSW